MSLASTRTRPACQPEEHSGLNPAEVAGDAAVERAARLFRTLGDPARLRLLSMLSVREVCVTEAAEAAGEEISTVSQRLRVLRAEGLVKRRRQGKHILYGLADGHVFELMANALAHAAEPAVAHAVRNRKERRDGA